MDAAEGILKWFSQGAWANGPWDQYGVQIQYSHRLKGIRVSSGFSMVQKGITDIKFVFVSHLAQKLWLNPFQAAAILESNMAAIMVSGTIGSGAKLN